MAQSTGQVIGFLATLQLWMWGSGFRPYAPYVRDTGGLADPQAAQAESKLGLFSSGILYIGKACEPSEFKNACPPHGGQANADAPALSFCGAYPNDSLCATRCRQSPSSSPACRGTEGYCRTFPVSLDCKGTQAHCLRIPAAEECRGTEAHCAFQPSASECAGERGYCAIFPNAEECTNHQ